MLVNKGTMASRDRWHQKQIVILSEATNGSEVEGPAFFH
jgi:hypothetical protein